MDAERQRVHDRIVDQQRRVDRLLEGRSDDAVGQRPTPERWSLGEHLEHLAITTGLYVDLLRDGFALARERGWTGDAPYRRGPVSGLAVRAMEPPIRLKLRAPRIMRPPSDAGRDEVASRFREAHDAFLQALGDADDVDLGRVLVTSPVTRLLRFRAIQACELVAAHVERHLWLIDVTGAAAE
ncbi:MAG: hypothetical protein GVY27_11745 [Deinococcus-Thermus bacterium]|jgi:hypothetical protein|nr:hypothetical protein [Deinococcota bacterium]